MSQARIKVTKEEADHLNLLPEYSRDLWIRQNFVMFTRKSMEALAKLDPSTRGRSMADTLKSLGWKPPSE